MPTRFPLAVPLSLALGAAMLAGCTRQVNDRLVLGEDVMLAAFAEVEQPSPDAEPAGPSVLGLDRSNWEPLVYEVPVNGVAHQPTYAPPTFDLDALPRQRGEYPTALSSLDLGEPSAPAELGQTLSSHGLAVLDAALFLPRLILRPPTATDWSPRVSYERASPHVITAPWCAVCEGPCADPQGHAGEPGAEPGTEPRVEGGQDGDGTAEE